MRLLGKFGQVVTLKHAVAFSDEYGSDGGAYIIGAGRDVVILDARGCPGARVYVVNGERSRSAERVTGAKFTGAHG